MTKAPKLAAILVVLQAVLAAGHQDGARMKIGPNRISRTKVLGFLLIGFVPLNSGCLAGGGLMAVRDPRPQAVTLKPEIQPPSASLGQGQPLLLTVVDQRPDSILGVRYPADSILGVHRPTAGVLTVAGDLTDIVRTALHDGLHHQGFRPTSDKPTDGRELRVEIEILNYNLSRESSPSTRRAACELKAICIIGSARPYEQLYRGEVQERPRYLPPNYWAKYLNSAVSKALNALLQDPGLGRCLAQEVPQP